MSIEILASKFVVVMGTYMRLSHTVLIKLHIVKPFNLAARYVCDFACKIILAPFILAN